jgi:hypothetical protein
MERARGRDLQEVDDTQKINIIARDELAVDLLHRTQASVVLYTRAVIS